MTTPAQDTLHDGENGHTHAAPPVGSSRPDAAHADVEQQADRMPASREGVRAALGKALTTAHRIVRQLGNIDARMGEVRETDARTVAIDILKTQELLSEVHRVLMNRLVEL